MKKIFGSGMTNIIIYTLVWVIGLTGLSACAKKSHMQGSFKATECKTICNNSECKTRCLSADGSFK